MTSADLAKDEAATINTSPSWPAGRQAQTSTTNVAMTTTATISFCSPGIFAMLPPREDLWPQTNSAGKQGPDLHVKVFKQGQVISNSVFTSEQRVVVVGSPARCPCNSLNVTDIWPSGGDASEPCPQHTLLNHGEHESNMYAQIVQFGANLNEKGNITYKLQKRYPWLRWHG